MKIIGTPPIPLFWFAVGKVSIVVCVLFFFGETFLGKLTYYQSFLLKITGMALFIIGGVISSAGISNLGKSTYMGLPTEETALKTEGLYRFSRNPIYLGMFLMCVGSSAYVIHPINILCAFLFIVIHHRIILAEERFLALRFGEAWTDYRHKVRRYL
ncbi:MAG: hypothetical protein CSYNP_02316 [Syntrophus sp. SKADARSKE-3]|nr:hypothetical protein [Syntrophus sp. SKADARSKE-3]